MSYKADPKYRRIEDTDVYRKFESIANELWGIVRMWDSFARSTVGVQLARAADSIGANLCEGDGRATDADALRFFTYARGSSRETEHWIRVAVARDLMSSAVGSRVASELDEAGRMLHGLMEYRRKRAGSGLVREESSGYPRAELAPDPLLLTPDS